MFSCFQDYTVRRPSLVNLLRVSLVAVCMCGCNAVNEPDPVELPDVPEKVVNMFNQRFPDATETTMRVVEKGNFWEADFKLGNVRFYAGMDSVEILRRLRLIDSQVPDSVRNVLINTTLANVELTDYREQVETFTNQFKEFVARYTYQNKEYEMLWTGGSDYYVLNSMPYYKFYGRMYPHYLPANILAFIEAENLRSIGGALFINEKNERQYRMNAQHDGSSVYDFIFDSKGTLLWTNFKRKDITSTLDLPAHIQAYLQQMEAEYGFRFSLGYEIYHTGGYSFYLQKGNHESLEVKLDKDANELDRAHMIYGNW